MHSDTDFKILLASLPNYRELVAEIYCDGKFVALISAERGVGLFDIETPGVELVEAEITRRVDLRKFLSAVESACQRLSTRE